MKKIIYSGFGGVEVLEMTNQPIPIVSERTLLIKVKAVSINPLDWKIRNGEMKLMSGSQFPRGIGIDFSGIVEEAGDKVHAYKKGDEVYGLLDVFKGAALSEYIVVEEKDISFKPSGISFEQAAAAPVVGSAALQIFDTLVNAQKGSEILINGASGGIGMFAIQIAKIKEANVTSIVSEYGIQSAKGWGSDVVIDYRSVDVLKTGKYYDIIVDLSNRMPYAVAKKIMRESSVYVHTAPGPKEIFSSFLTSMFFKKKYKVLMLKPSSRFLKQLTEFIENGLAIVIGKNYPLDLFREAYTEAEEGHFIGKAVITIDN